MPFLLTLIVGAAAGFLAVRFMGLQVGVLISVAIGVLGAIVGGVVLRGLLILFMGATSVLSLFVGGLLGAVTLIWIYKKITNK